MAYGPYGAINGDIRCNKRGPVLMAEGGQRPQWFIFCYFSQKYKKKSIGHFNAKVYWSFNQFCFCSDWCLCLVLLDRISITVSKPGFKRTRSKPACPLLRDFFLSAEWSPILYGAISSTCYSKPLSFPSRDFQCHWSFEYRALNRWRHCGSLSLPGSSGSNQIWNLVRKIRSSGPGKGKEGRRAKVSSKRNPPTHGHITPCFGQDV